jgi:hypothetical protein
MSKATTTVTIPVLFRGEIDVTVPKNVSHRNEFAQAVALNALLASSDADGDVDELKALYAVHTDTNLTANAEKKLDKALESSSPESVNGVWSVVDYATELDILSAARIALSENSPLLKNIERARSLDKSDIEKLRVTVANRISELTP